MTEKKHTKEHKRMLEKLGRMVDYRHSERWFQHIIKGVIFLIGFAVLFYLSSAVGMIYGENRRLFMLALIFLADFIAFGIAKPIKSWTRFILYWPLLLVIYFIILGDCFFFPNKYAFPWWLRGFMVTS